VGDSFIALCKLASRAEQAPCRLRRICLHAGSDSIIVRLAALFPKVTYEPDFVHFTSIAAMRAYAFANRDRYLNIFADGDGRGNEPDDPPGLRLEPHPELRLTSAIEMSPSPVVGIHMHSGTAASGPRVLSTRSVVSFCEAVSGSAVQVMLFGTGEVFADAELACLGALGPNVTNMVGRDTFDEWVGMLAAVDLLIAPEGLATFLAMSQRVPTLALFDRADAVLRMPWEWRRLAVCVRPPVSEVLGRERWGLPDPATLAGAVLARLDPDALGSRECSK
jgi:hypothetical protein